MSAPVQNPATPHLQQIPGGFHPGSIVHVTGTYTPGAASLIIKLQTGPSGDPADEIGLCIYGRVREGQLGRNCLTRATGWGTEELSHGVAGLAPGVGFDIAILCDPQNFKIAYNGQHLCEYVHRLNPASLTYLQIGSLPGDLTLSCVWVEQPARAAPASAPSYAAPPSSYSMPSAPGGASAPSSYSMPSAPGGASLPYNPNPQSGYAPPPGMQQPPNTYQQNAPYGGQQYPPQQGHHQQKGLSGMIGGAAAAVGAQGLLNKATNMIGGKSSGYSSHGGNYPQGGAYPPQGGAYPSQGGAYPSQGGAYPPQGGGYGGGGGGYYPQQYGGGGMKSNGSSGVLKTAAVLAPAAIAIAGPGKALKYGAPLAAAGMLSNRGKSGGVFGMGGGGGNKLLKYGAPLAAGYLVTKGVKKGFGGLGSLGGFGGGDWSGCDSDSGSCCDSD